MTTEQFTFFWGEDSPFSQWHPSPFIHSGELYHNAEQFMMAAKAKIFHDYATLYKIMNTHNPKLHKALGRQVKNFNETRWFAVAQFIVYRGNIAKFSQNPKLCEILIKTIGTTLVEASPYDKIWGIGLTENDPRSKNRSTWQGRNWLGETLTAARGDISKGLIGQCLYCTLGPNNNNICTYPTTFKSTKCLIDIKDCPNFNDIITV